MIDDATKKVLLKVFKPYFDKDRINSLFNRGLLNKKGFKNGICVVATVVLNEPEYAIFKVWKDSNIPPILFDHNKHEVDMNSTVYRASNYYWFKDYRGRMAYLKRMIKQLENETNG